MKILIVGAGFSGAVIARELAEFGYDITILDKRSHIGGNAYDFTHESGIRIHKYGPHLFHTNSKLVFDYLSKFCEWIPYYHKVKAMLNDGTLVTLPVNLETKAIVGEDRIIETFIRPYSEKMWGMKLEDIDPQILKRVPIRNDNNDLYFPNDEFQYMPKYGYTFLFEQILDHPNIKLELNTNFERSKENNFDHIFNSMPIDEYYDFCYGELPYRSIKFHQVEFPSPFVLPVSTINFTNNSPFTRMVEWKRFPEHGKNNNKTIITYEEPCDYKENNMERYYPVKDQKGTNRELYLKYRSIPNEKTTFIGRLGMYVYLDMDQTISSSLKTVNLFKNNFKQ